MRTQASFEPVPVSAREARRFLRSFLEARGVDGDGADGAEVALSEVVTNAVLHAHTPFAVALALDDDGVLRVEVHDGNPQLPVQRDYAVQATTGRGMELVAAYARDCGVRVDGPAGKTVWFEVDLQAAADGTDGLSEQDLLDAWDLDDAPAAPADAAELLLLSMPPTLWLAAREHHDAVLREFMLFASEHPDEAPAADRLAAADRARTWISTRVLAELEGGAARASAHRALPEGHPSPLPDAPPALDLRVPVPPDAAGAFAALQDVLDAAEGLAAQGRLLARPALPEVVAVRDWACEQAISQRAGISPKPWPGTSQDRFTDAGGLADDELARWQGAVPEGPGAGGVVADEANRILAVTPALAAGLGYTPEQLVGRRVVVLIPPALREAHVAGFTRHLTTGEAHAIGVPLRLPVLRADGSTVECGFLIEQRPLPQGGAVYVAWVTPDA